jgi:hypothetical protein
MEHDKATSPDGFPAGFYQKNWAVIKMDLLALFSVLHIGQLDLFRKNLGDIIILLPIFNQRKGSNGIG